MSKRYDLIIKNGRVFQSQPGSKNISSELTDVGVKDGKIIDIGQLPKSDGDKTMDATNFLVLPGLIDTQVHFREPGNEHKEDLASGTRAAVMGGITGVFEMPNTKPATISAIDLQDKLGRAKGRAWCEHAFYLGACKENAHRIHEIEALPGCCGIKIFMGSSTGDLLVDQPEVLETIVSNGKRRMAIHCEDEKRLVERKKIVQEQPGQVQLHPVWRDETTALNATKLMVELSKKYSRPAHILHISTKEEMQFLKQNKDQNISVECTPQHLVLSAPDCYEKFGTFAQMNPPIRSAEHQKGIWQGLLDGTVDIVGSDHAPHTREEKQKVYPSTPSGMPGVQTILPLLLEQVHKNKITIEQIILWMAHNPQKLFGIKNKCHIHPGFDADFSIIDPNKTITLTDQMMESKCGWTPFDGMEIHGFPIATIIRGNIVMRDGQLIGSPQGQAINFEF